MKQAIKSVLAFVAAAMAATSFADGGTVNGITWHTGWYGSGYYADNYGIVRRNSGPVISANIAGAVTVPSKIQSTSLSSCSTIRVIGPIAFNGCSKLTSITVPSCVKKLCYCAFSGTPALKSIILEGNAPEAEEYYSQVAEKWENPFTGCGTDAAIYVYPSSKNWGVTIPGKWNGIPIRYMKSINFDANGGNVSAATRWRSHDLPVGDLPTPTKTEATFNGWFTAKSGGTQISASTTVSANTTFYAHWTMNQYTVTFDANEGVGGTSKTQDWGTTIGTVAVPTRTGYIFKGWFTEASGGEKAKITESSKIECDKTYFAHWERDPIPEMVSGETVAEVLAGAADETLAAKLGTTRNYKNYRGWVDDKALEHKAVKESPNAWLAYALDAPGLIAKPSAVAKEDFTFEAGSSVTEEPGKMAFDFSIDGVTIGEEAELDEVFAITGAATLEEGAFTESGMTALLERTSDGKVSVSVEPPKDGNGKIPDKYFFRVRVK